MGGSLINNLLVYTHNGGSPVTSFIDVQISISGSPKRLVKVYIPGVDSPI